MKINNLLIHLYNSVDAFNLKPRHIDLIRENLPDLRITVAEGTRDFLERLPEADCVLAWVFKSDWYDGAPKLKALFTPAAGVGIWISETISSAARTVDPGTTISQNCSESITRLFVLIFAFNATSAGAVSLGFTARQYFTPPKIEWYLLSPAMAKHCLPPFR